MTTRELLHSEADNRDRIVLYREGLFWKAYERSAFAVCTQIRPFKPTRRAIKSAGGAHLVSIGFPVTSEETVLKGLQRVEVTPECLVVAAPRAIVVVEFEAWKAAVPLQLPRKSSAAPDGSSPSATAAASEVGAAVRAEAVAGPPPAHPLTGLPALPETDRNDAMLAAERAVVERLRRFDLASSTPMECMCFLSELKKTLSNLSDRGSIR